MQIDLGGRTALVTGSTSGIGYAAVASLARSGAAVVVHGRGDERAALQIPTEMVHYGVTKTAQLSVSRGLAQTVAGTGVTVNCVLPGPTLTEGVREFIQDQVGRDMPFEAAERVFIAEHRPTSLIRRLLRPEEVANMITYLASENAAGTTAGALRVDGGLVNNIIP